MNPLATGLSAPAAGVNTRVLQRELADPFWLARYGERARRFIQEDGAHHLRYLDEAIAGGSDETFVRYARWLRGVLVSRGMCTHHLVRNFELLGQVLVESGRPDAERANAVLDAGIAALRPRGEAGRFSDAAERRIDDDAATIARTSGADVDQVRRDLRCLSSYLADAVADGRDAIFLEHVAWRRGPGAAAIAGGLDRALPTLARTAARCGSPAAQQLVAQAMASTQERSA